VAKEVSVLEEAMDNLREAAQRIRATQNLMHAREQADLDRNTIGRIENTGITEVHPRTIRKRAEALSVDPASLVPKE
jgi:hypothetical protein